MGLRLISGKSNRSRMWNLFSLEHCREYKSWDKVRKLWRARGFSALCGFFFFFFLAGLDGNSCTPSVPGWWPFVNKLVYCVIKTISTRQI